MTRPRPWNRFKWVAFAAMVGGFAYTALSLCAVLVPPENKVYGVVVGIVGALAAAITQFMQSSLYPKEPTT